MALSADGLQRVEVIAHTLAENAMVQAKAFADKTFDKCSADTRARLAGEYMRFVSSIINGANGI